MKTNLTRLFLLPSILLLAATGIASAQATRTWVSGVGDDANPCSRTAPCKTFAGAISKTATAGEINVLDPGGFGGVTITKSITIRSEFEAGVLVPGTNAIIINAPAGSIVQLEGLDVNGLNTGLNGIRFLGGKALYVHRCLITQCTNSGIDFEPAATTPNAQLVVTDTRINTCGAAAGNFAGILVKPAATTLAFAKLDKVNLDGNKTGLRAEDGARVVAHHTIATGNTDGFVASDTAANAAVISLESCIASNNSTNGIHSENATAIVSISDVLVTANLSAGLRSTSSGQIISSGNNRIYLNAADTAPAVGVPTQTINQK